MAGDNHQGGSVSHRVASQELEGFQVHAFSRQVHGGNPAGVCLLDQWLTADEMRRIARDIGPSVTAFVLNSDDGVHALRWFTRGGLEVDSFCGHATFSAAHVLLEIKRSKYLKLEFSTVTGPRYVARSGDYLTMTVPYWRVEEIPCPDLVRRSLDVQPERCFRGPRDLMLLFRTAEEVRRLTPDYTIMRALGHTGVIATAQDASSQVVHRFFCPGFSIGEDEDHATGSAMSTLAPYWTARLGTPTFSALQASERGGFFVCGVEEGVITVSSRCATFLNGSIRPGTGSGQDSSERDMRRGRTLSGDTPEIP
jgi:predicted PhzF superfamily epimerase YddE/YHI9